ncbi:MAG: replication-associated recombination protein A [Firmicutes bacterium]|nr:replication-associated recombination protein A [Bacillota bacterium]
MDLFEPLHRESMSKESPLAARMRPRTLEEFIGQEEILGPGRVLRRLIETDQITSLIFYGPPGCGKTSLASVISNLTRSSFRQMGSVSANVKEIRDVLREAEDQRRYQGRKTILFIDEIHHLNKSQQDILLPAVEDGTIILIGATTENPFFEINSALLSRSRIFPFRPLNTAEVLAAMKQALADQERGLGQYQVDIADEALEYLAGLAEGDLRTAYTALEAAVLSTPVHDGVRSITRPIIEEAAQKRVPLYDRAGDQHYDVISAFIKSVRGSDVDAALYWLALMLYSGEDPRFIVRRMIILASEDIGLADPQAMLIVQAAAQALEWVGLPEARIPIAEAVIYLCLAPKSNSSYLAINQAMQEVEKGTLGRVPKPLRDASYPGARQLGHGKGYLYPHDYPGHWVKQDYLPPHLKDVRFFKPGTLGWESRLKPRRTKDDD